MEYMTGELNDGTTPYSAFKENEGKVISIKGAIHNIRDMSDFAFIILRTARDLIQCVYSPEFSEYRLTENGNAPSATNTPPDSSLVMTGVPNTGESRTKSTSAPVSIRISTASALEE